MYILYFRIESYLVIGFFFQNAPKPKKKIKDLFDLNGTTPYKTEEIVPGKLWEITYTFENSARFDEDAKNEMKAFGMDYSSETCIRKILEGAASHGENVVETAKRDIQIALDWAEKKTFTDTEMLEAYDNKLKTFVVKLNNGNLLLYAPVQIRDEVGFGTWIESLGKVEWIIVASCYHTLHLQNVLERYIYDSGYAAMGALLKPWVLNPPWFSHTDLKSLIMHINLHH